MTYPLKAYDDALQDILENGVKKESRTGVDTLAIFCIQSRYRIDECWPLCTRRKLNPKSVLAELLWFISGSTNNDSLKELGANFWTPWVDKSFESQHHFVPGALGPLYGFQLRHFGGNYNMGIENDMGYGYGGIDQLQYVINEIKKYPDSRRILWSLWNPKQIEQMRLPPCHYAFQFFVDGDKLSGVLSQRSCDFPVGVPFNIAFYSAMIYLVASLTGLKPYEFIHWTADSHIYVDQIDAVHQYLARPVVNCPQLKITPAETIDDFTMDHFEVIDYNPQPHIKIPVAV